MDDWLTTAEAAALLGVKPQTLYAYVSRGQLARRPAEEGNASLFHREDVAREMVEKAGVSTQQADQVLRLAQTEGTNQDILAHLGQAETIGPGFALAPDQHDAIADADTGFGNVQHHFGPPPVTSTS